MSLVDGGWDGRSIKRRKSKVTILSEGRAGAVHVWSVPTMAETHSFFSCGYICDSKHRIPIVSESRTAE